VSVQESIIVAKDFQIDAPKGGIGLSAGPLHGLAQVGHAPQECELICLRQV
jgi:hypothetical protein